MTDYIERSDACNECVHCKHVEDVAEIKHGSWKSVNKERGNPTDGIWTERYLQCSVCNYERRHSWLRGEQPPYCENCGSKMDGDI